VLMRVGGLQQLLVELPQRGVRPCSAGRTVIGWREWKNTQGKTLRELIPI
jgi:hypothetical protein